MRNVGAGEYTVTVTDDFNCVVKDTLIFNDPPPLGSSAVFTNISCFGGSDGSIDVTAIGGVGAYTYAWNDISPEAFYAFDGDTDDITGNNHHATGMVGNITYSTDAIDGDFSAEFDGASGIRYDDGSFLASSFNERTVLMWIKPNDFEESQTLYDEGGISGGIGMRINGNRLEASVVGGFERYGPIDMQLPIDNDWHQVGFVFDNGELTLIVDGVTGPTFQTPIRSVWLPDPFPVRSGLGHVAGTDVFGNQQFQERSFYSGLMDNVAIFNEALTVQQITDNNTDDGDRSGLPAGDYQVFVFDLNGCRAVSYTHLTLPTKA